MMSNCSETMRQAVTQESRLLAREIAGLGERIAAGNPAVAELQGFDALSQTAAALGHLIDHLTPWLLLGDALAAIETVPLPAMRRRLHLALGLIEQEDDGTAPLDEADLWLREAAP